MDETKPATQVFPETRAIVSSDGDVMWVIPVDDTPPSHSLDEIDILCELFVSQDQ